MSATPTGHRWLPRPVLPLRTWLLLSYLVVLTLPVIAVLGSGALGSDLRNQTRWDLEHQGAAVALLVQAERRAAPTPRGLADLEPRLSASLRALKERTLAGYRVVDADGVIVASSATDDDGEHGSAVSAPEVQRALAGATATTITPRPRARQPAPLSSKSRRATVRVNVAVPIHDDQGAVIGAVVMSRTPREEAQALYQMGFGGLMFGAIGALAITVTLALAWGYLLSRSLGALAKQADAIADGDYGVDATATGVDATATRVTDGAIGALGALTDSHVAEVGQVARASATMARRLGERLSYIAEFAGNVSHEFKTPLSTLRGTLELIADDDAMPAEQRQRFLTNAVASIDHLERLVTGLLALARAEEVRDRQPIALLALLTTQCAALSVPFAPDDSLTPTCAARADAGQLTLALTNLVANARAHGGPNARVVAHATEAQLTFGVADDGTGISEANQARVFERFFTTRRGRGGTGLGLALVRTIAEAHGGQADLRSSPDGTLVTVSIPRIREAASKGR